jgi:hypothetical protein
MTPLRKELIDYLPLSQTWFLNPMLPKASSRTTTLPPFHLVLTELRHRLTPTIHLSLAPA